MSGSYNEHQFMAALISYGAEMIRISPKSPSKIEYSKNGGSSWISRYTGSSYGEFMSLSDGGNVLLATTSKGLYYSKNGGSSWLKK